MPRPYSLDLRVRVAERCQDPTQTIDEIAEWFGLGTATVKRFKAAAKAGDLSPKPPGGGKPRKIPNEDEETIRRLLATKNDSTLKEWVARIKVELGTVLSITTMSRTFERMEITRKKGVFMPPNGTRSALNKRGRHTL